MLLLTRRAPTDDSPTSYASGRARRTLLFGTAGVAALAAVGGAGGLALDRVRQARIAARRALGLPAPTSPAPALPAGVQVEGVSPFITPLNRFYRVDISLVTPGLTPAHGACGSTA